MICVAASPSIDTSFEVDELTLGTIHRPSAHIRVAGGKALNVARSARRLGADPLAIALLAEHGGAWIAEQTAREGIALLAHRVPGEVRQCLSVLDAGGALTEFYEYSRPVDSEAWLAFARLAVERCEPGRWFAIGGSLPPNVAEDAYGALIREASSRGAPTALDASGRALEMALAAGPDVVKVNEEEARQLLGVRRQARAEPERELPALAAGARELRDLTGAGERIAIITRGDQGAVLAGPDDLLLAARPLGRAPYPVGSGDAFMAGLLVGRERELDWAGALCLAHAAGTANAERPGPGAFDPARAEALARVVELQVL